MNNETAAVTTVKRNIKKFEIECEYVGENERNNFNVVQMDVCIKGEDGKILRDISFTTAETDLGNMFDKDIKEYAFEYVKDDFEMADSKDDKYKFFMENSEVVFVEGNMDVYDEEEVEKAIKSIDVECIAFADQEDTEEKEYTLNIKVIGYDDNEYWIKTDEDITVIVENGDDEEELVTEEIINLITEECSLQISEQFIMENININMYL